MVGRNNLGGHVYLFLVVLLTFRVGTNNLSGHVYIFLAVLLIFILVAVTVQWL